MKRDDLEKLRIPQDQRFSRGAHATLIYVAIAIILLVAAWFARPRSSDSKRLVSQTQPRQVDAASPTTLPISAPPPPAPGEVLLTTSGYIINRERIELSPRFEMLSTLNWEETDMRNVQSAMVTMILIALPLCKREAAASSKQSPATLEESGQPGIKRVTLTVRAAERLGIETAQVREETVTIADNSVQERSSRTGRSFTTRRGRPGRSQVRSLSSSSGNPSPLSVSPETRLS